METIKDRIHHEGIELAGNHPHSANIIFGYVEGAISERNRTIDEANYIIIDYLNDASDNALQTFNERILGLKIDLKG